MAPALLLLSKLQAAWLEGEERRDGRSVHGTPEAHAYPLFWKTFTLERITPNWLSWKEGYLLLKSKTRNKNTACKTIYLQPCSCQDSARLTLTTNFPCLSVSREIWMSSGNCLFPSKAGAVVGVAGSEEMLLSCETCPAAELWSSGEQNCTAHIALKFFQVTIYFCCNMLGKALGY